MSNILQQTGRWLHMIFEEQKQNQRKNTIVVLDGVRACAIIFVIIFHINRTTGDSLWDWHTNPLASAVSTAGGTGVTLFFVLSGFLLFLPYAKALLTACRWPPARTFYLRRALRIMPGYYISLFVLIFLTAPQYLQPAHLNELGLFLTFLMDSSQQTFRALNGPYWTLATEWQFYMILPLLALGILWLVRRVRIERRLRAVTFCLLGIIVGGLFVRFWGFYFQGHPNTTFLVPRSVLNVVLFFAFGITGKYTEDFAVGMLGALIYMYAQNLPAEHHFTRRLRRLSLWLWGVGILILVFSAMWHFQDNPPPHSNAPVQVWAFLDPFAPYFSWLSEMLLAFGFGMCIMAILFGPRELQRPLAWKPLRWIGLISYSLYIWHLPFIVLWQKLLATYWPNGNYYVQYALYWVWALIVILPFCVLYYAFIERPGIKLGDHWRKQIEAHHLAHLQAKERAQIGKASEAEEDIRAGSEVLR